MVGPGAGCNTAAASFMMPIMSVAAAHPSRVRLLSAPGVGGAVLLLLVVACLASLPWSIEHYASQDLQAKLQPPGEQTVLGTDRLGRSMLARCLFGGAISLGVGLAAAAISVCIGAAWGMLSGYLGGRVDALMMRTVDVLYGLPYILLVVLFSVALQEPLSRLVGPKVGNFVTLLVAIGAVSWLTLARVVRGQVLSIKAQPFIESARAAGVPVGRMLLRHVLPNLIGPIIVYTTLTVPQAILQESFLSFLGIGIRPPLPSWGNLAAEGLSELNPVRSHWWLLLWPCMLLAMTLLALNFLGDGLRDRFDPRSQQRD